MAQDRPKTGLRWPKIIQDGPRSCIFSGSFFGIPFAPKILFLAMKNQDFEVHFGAQNGSARGAHFSRFFGVSPEPPFWLYLGLILAPSWPLLGSSWPHLGPSWPHLGPILASSWPSWPFLAPSWPLLGPVLALLAALGPILALGSLLANWSAFLNPGFRPPLPQVCIYIYIYLSEGLKTL